MPTYITVSEMDESGCCCSGGAGEDCRTCDCTGATTGCTIFSNFTVNGVNYGTVQVEMVQTGVGACSWTIDPSWVRVPPFDSGPSVDFVIGCGIPLDPTSFIIQSSVPFRFLDDDDGFTCDPVVIDWGAFDNAGSTGVTVTWSSVMFIEGACPP